VPGIRCPGWRTTTTLVWARFSHGWLEFGQRIGAWRENDEDIEMAAMAPRLSDRASD